MFYLARIDLFVSADDLIENVSADGRAAQRQIRSLGEREMFAQLEHARWWTGTTAALPSAQRQPREAVAAR
ncbi:MAG: hypothetical protein WDN76_00595 [Alphaproteobacteria bacterium]